jgi:hypothetical protein
MKDYWVMWTYVANFSPLIHIYATTPEAALAKATCVFSDDFRKRASVYVFDVEPVLERLPAKVAS